MPQVGPRVAPEPEAARYVVGRDTGLSLWLFEVGLACCAVEFVAASLATQDFERMGVETYAADHLDRTDVMVVSGTVTDKMAPSISRLYDELPEPKYVISFGSCSNCGGPYWDSYCVTKGVDQIIPVDVYVPGCPPRPEALLHGILRLQEKIGAESLSDRYHWSPRGHIRSVGADTLTAPLVAPPEADAHVS
jgi:NADH-quinone oxidoreductase subunit B